MERIDSYLREHEWQKKKTDDEVTTYFKNRILESNKSFEFLSYSKKKENISLLELSNKANGFFSHEGYSVDTLPSVVNPCEDDTFFIIAGVQYFADYFHGKKNLDNRRYFIPQPVIRTKCRQSIGEGCLSAFVNISTEQCGATVKDHVCNMDRWMNFLSKSGLYLGDFVLQLKEADNRRLRGYWKNTEGIVLTFDYGGLVLGDAVLFAFEDKEETLISDIGFGLERLAWAVNKTDSFFDIIGPTPFSFMLDPYFIDAVRTTTLMLLSGLNRTNDDAYRQFRKYVETVPALNSDWRYLIGHYHAFWRSFMKQKRDLCETFCFFERELNRNRNKALMKALGTSKGDISKCKLSMDMDTDSFIGKLVKSRMVSLNEIKKIYSGDDIDVSENVC